MESLIPKKADWIQDSVTQMEPDTNHVVLSNGQTIGYDYLVVAAGIQINWDKIKGLKEALGKDGVTSNYSPESVQKTYQFLQEFKGGNALFSYPNSMIKVSTFSFRFLKVGMTGKTQRKVMIYKTV